MYKIKRCSVNRCSCKQDEEIAEHIPTKCALYIVGKPVNLYPKNKDGNVYIENTVNNYTGKQSTTN